MPRSHKAPPTFPSSDTDDSVPLRQIIEKPRRMTPASSYYTSSSHSDVSRPSAKAEDSPPKTEHMTHELLEEEHSSFLSDSADLLLTRVDSGNRAEERLAKKQWNHEQFPGESELPSPPATSAQFRYPSLEQGTRKGLSVTLFSRKVRLPDCFQTGFGYYGDLPAGAEELISAPGMKLLLTSRQLHEMSLKLALARRNKA